MEQLWKLLLDCGHDGWSVPGSCMTPRWPTRSTGTSHPSGSPASARSRFVPLLCFCEVCFEEGWNWKDGETMVAVVCDVLRADAKMQRDLECSDRSKYTWIIIGAGEISPGKEGGYCCKICWGREYPAPLIQRHKFLGEGEGQCNNAASHKPWFKEIEYR